MVPPVSCSFTDPLVFGSLKSVCLWLVGLSESDDELELEDELSESEELDSELLGSPLSALLLFFDFFAWDLLALEVGVSLFRLSSFNCLVILAMSTFI